MIQNAAIGTLQLQDGAVNRLKIAQASIQEGHIIDAQITTAKIRDAQITSAKIDGTIQSTNYVPYQSGWQINKSGNIYLNGSTVGQGRMTLEPDRIVVYDVNGNVRVVMGRL